MLVLLSFALVLVATVLLVLGLLNDDNGMTLIYLSIASSVAAAIVLLVALKVSKPRQEVQRAAPEPLPEPEPEPALATVGAATAGASASERREWLASDQDRYAAQADADDDRWRAGGDDEPDEVEFPIADYDSLTAGQILPLLPQLYADEIPIVEERERATKARPEILDKLAELRAGFTAGSTLDAPPAEPATVARESETTPTPVDPLASYTEPSTSTAGGWDDDADWFPIEDYESLSAAQIRPLLPELDEEELRMVRDKEAALGRRRSLLDEIDRLLGEPVPGAGTAAPEPPAPAPAPEPTAPTVPSEAGAPAAPTARAAAKRASTTSAGTKRAPAKKAPAKKAAAKKAAAKKAASKAPAKKAAAKKSPAAKAPAKKAATKKATAKKATAKKAAPKKATKATGKKTPAKKSTKRTRGG